jgi:hypothetical protein
MNLRTIKIEIEIEKVKNQKKKRFYGNGEWYCIACGDIYSSLEIRSLNINPEEGCPNCDGQLRYEEI